MQQLLLDNAALGTGTLVSMPRICLIGTFSLIIYGGLPLLRIRFTHHRVPKLRHYAHFSRQRPPPRKKDEMAPEEVASIFLMGYYSHASGWLVPKPP